MKQSDNPQEFFKKFGFNLSSKIPCKEFPDEVLSFEGLEASYVSGLERDVKELQQHANELQKRIWFLQEKEYRKPFKELMGENK